MERYKSSAKYTYVRIAYKINGIIIVCTNTQIEITHRIAWRRNSIQGGTCTDNTIESEELLGSGELVCRQGCSGTVGSMRYFCTDFSSTDNWSMGEMTYERDLGSTIDFEAS